MDSQTSQFLNNNQIYNIETWKEFQGLVGDSQYKRWAFRGQEKAEWPLNSTLSRYLIDYKLHQDCWGHQEDRIIRIFRRKAKLFLQHIPTEDDIFQWLALMQHYGAPTRLIDFTWSPFVAAFFALEKAKTDCAVWAVNTTILKKIEYYFPPNQVPLTAPRPESGLEHYRQIFIRNTNNGRVPFITAGEPYDMNQRQIAQSGTFLIPGILHIPIEGILSSYQPPEKVIVKFVLRSSKIRDEAMESLYYMNISNATLFPGLEGMAHSLAYELEFHWAFNPKTRDGYEEYLSSL